MATLCFSTSTSIRGIPRFSISKVLEFLARLSMLLAQYIVIEVRFCLLNSYVQHLLVESLVHACTTFKCWNIFVS